MMSRLYFCLRFVIRLFTTCSIAAALVVSVRAQDEAPPAETATESTAGAAADTSSSPDDSADVDKPARAEFEKVLGEWKDVLTQLRDLRAEFLHLAEDDKLPELRENYEDLKTQGSKLLPSLRKAALAAFQESPNEDRQLTRFLIKMAIDSNEHDDYEVAWEVASSLVASECEDKRVYEQAGIAAFCVHDFDSAEKFLKQAEAFGVLNDKQAKEFLAVVGDYKGYWAEEQELRAKEAEAGNLPRVKLVTTKGTIVLELFENEAPDTVGNFVHLVKSGFYSDKTFHRVLGRFMAQGGCPKGDGTGGPGYDIFCECHQPNHRKHFRGSLSMAHAGRDTGGSQFFLTFVPAAGLNGDHTVFGRVVEGFDVLRRLQRIDPQDEKSSSIAPDKIIRAEVSNLRDHEYVPNKVQRR